MNRRATMLFRLLSLALLAALPYLVFGGLRTFIQMDDDLYVFDNPVVLRGITWSGMRWAVTAFHSANWHPLTWLSHMLDVSLFGTAAFGHHLTSVLLHALNTALLALALARLTGRVWPAWCAAALFGVHPLRVESVAWVAERKDVLSGLFFMLVLLAYERYARRGGARRYLLVAALLALGLMSKPMLVTAPFVLLLLDFWPLGRLRPMGPAGEGVAAPRPWKRLAVEKIPLLALSAASSVVTFMAQKHGGAVSELTKLSAELPIVNALVSYVSYLGKTAWPSALGILYPHPLVSPPWWNTAGAALLLALVSLAALRLSGRRPYLFVGWSWFLGMLVPVIGLIQVGEQALADRYTYLPAVGLSLVLAWGMPEAFRRLHLGAPYLRAVAVLALAALTAASARQASRWRESEILFRHTLAVTAPNPSIHNNLAIELAEQGRREESIAELKEALRLRPFSAEAHHNLAIALEEAGRRAEAIPHFAEAVRYRPNLAVIRYRFGRALSGSGRYGEAIAELGEAVRINPGYPEAFNELGLALFKYGRLNEAIPRFEQALRLKPDFPDAHNNLGVDLAALGRPDEGIAHYREALRLDADHADAHLNLGNALAVANRAEEAIAHYRESIRLRPDLPEAYTNWGSILIHRGRVGEAIGLCRTALRLKPDYPDAHNNLGIALTISGKHDEAIRHLQEALRLQPGNAEYLFNLNLARSKAALGKGR